MKKGIVLLMTLFFITAISVLVLKNLKDTEQFLEKQNYQLNNTQILIAIKNTLKEVAKLIKENKESVDEALQNDIFQNSIPFEIEDLKIDFTISNYSKVDVNKIKDKDSNEVKNLFFENNVFDYDQFVDIYNEKLPLKDSKVETTKQLEDIISDLIKQVGNEDIKRLKDKLGFLNESNLYELSINANYFSSKAKAYYILTNKGKVVYLDISFN